MATQLISSANRTISLYDAAIVLGSANSALVIYGNKQQSQISESGLLSQLVAAVAESNGPWYRTSTGSNPSAINVLAISQVRKITSAVDSDRAILLSGGVAFLATDSQWDGIQEKLAQFGTIAEDDAVTVTVTRASSIKVSIVQVDGDPKYGSNSGDWLEPPVTNENYYFYNGTTGALNGIFVCRDNTPVPTDDEDIYVFENTFAIATDVDDAEEDVNKIIPFDLVDGSPLGLPNGYSLQRVASVDISGGYIARTFATVAAGSGLPNPISLIATGAADGFYAAADPGNQVVGVGLTDTGSFGDAIGFLSSNGTDAVELRMSITGGTTHQLTANGVGGASEAKFSRGVEPTDSFNVFGDTGVSDLTKGLAARNFTAAQRTAINGVNPALLQLLDVLRAAGFVKYVA